MDINKLTVIFREHKKWIVAGGIALFATFAIIAIGAGFVIYKTATIATDTVQQWPSRDSVNAATSAATNAAGTALQSIARPEPGFVESALLGVASGWLSQELSSSDLTSLQNGLSCFNSLGGPSPAEVVSYIKNRTTDQTILAQLNKLHESLTPMTPNAPAACTNWILQS